MSVLVVGSIALDNIKTPFGEVKKILGGSAVYFSYAASFFTQVKIVATIGEDFPQEYITLLKKRNNIDTEGIKTLKGKTFTWSGEYKDELNKPQTLSTCLNVFEKFEPILSENHKNSKYIFLANIDPKLQLQVLNQVNKLQMSFCDTRDLWINTKKEILIKLIKKIDVLILNEVEIQYLCNEKNLFKAAKKLLLMGPKIVVIKKGSHGVLMITKNSFFGTIAYPLEEIYDPTGCGDAFAGGFIGYLTQTENFVEENLKKAIIYGSVLASFTIEDFGLRRLFTLTTKDIKTRYEEFKKLTCF